MNEQDKKRLSEQFPETYQAVLYDPNKQQLEIYSCDSTTIMQALIFTEEQNPNQIVVSISLSPDIPQQVLEQEPITHGSNSITTHLDNQLASK